MQLLVLFLIVLVCSVEFLKRLGWVPGPTPYLQELIGGMVLIYVIAAGMRTRFQNVRPAYWIVFGAVGLTMLCGMVVNALEPGPMFGGMRTYLRAMPLFFLPAVYAFSDRQIRTQLMVLMAICFAQVPIAIMQRMATIARGGITGDETSGSLLISSILSIFLICALCVLTALFLRRRISGWLYLLLFVVLIFPTTINETKGTLLLLPLGLMVTFLVFARPGARLKNVVLATVLLGVFGAIFIPVYDHLIQARPYATKISEYFTEEGRLKRYLAKDAEVGTTGKAGRLDAMQVPVQELAKDPARLMFGLGIGNVSNSALGEQFVGRYFRKFEPFLLTAFSRLVLEIGVLGLTLVMVLYWLIFKDARVVASNDTGLKGAIAGGWAGVTAVIAVSTFYKDVVAFESLSFLFWYFSGVIAAERVRMWHRARVPEARAASHARPAAIA